MALDLTERLQDIETSRRSRDSLTSGTELIGQRRKHWAYQLLLKVKPMAPLCYTVPEAASRQVHVPLGITRLTDSLTHQSPWRADDPTDATRVTSKMFVTAAIGHFGWFRSILGV